MPAASTPEKTIQLPFNHLLSRLIGGFLVLNLIVAGIILSSLYRSKHYHEDRAAVSTQNISQVLDENISGIFARIDIALQAVADEGERQLSTGSIKDAVFNNFIIREHSRIPELVAFRATDASGNAIYGPQAIPAKTASLSHRDYFKFLRDTPGAGLVISKPLIGGITGKWMVILARRLNHPDGSFAGLVYAGVTIDYFSRIFSKIDVGEQGSIALYDRDFGLVSRFTPVAGGQSEVGLKVKSPQLNALIGAGKTSGTYLAKSSVDSVLRTFSFRKLPLSSPFYIVVGVATADYLAEWHKECLQSALFMAGFLLISAVSVVLIQREWKRNRAAQGALIASEQKFRSFVENANDLIYTLSPSGVFSYLSPNWEELLGYCADELLGKPIEVILHPEDAHSYRAFVKQVFKAGGKQGGPEYRVLHKNKSWHWHISNASLMESADNKGPVFFGIARDITEAKEAVEKLQKNEERLRVIFETVQAGIILVNPSGVIEFANRRMADMFGCSPVELIGSAYVDFVHPEERQVGDARMHLLMSGEIDHVSSERHYQRRDGSDFWGFLSGRRLEAPDGQFQALIGVITDISDRKHAERKLLQSEAKFAAIFKMSPDSININRVDDGVFLEVNESFTAMFGYSADDVLGKLSSDFDIWENPDDKDRIYCLLKEQGNVKNLECRLHRKDGGNITALISSRLLEIDGALCALHITRDITEREVMQKEVIKAQKLESLGVLAGGIAHDFNNILTGILGNISLAKLTTDESLDTFSFLVRAEKASQRAVSLAKQLLVFAKGGQPVKKMISLQDVLQEAVSLALSGTNVRGQLQIPVPLSHIEADEGQISQAFHNIVLNAVHSMEGGGTLTVRGENVALVDDSVLGLASGQYVKLSFSDEGCGISESDQKRIFDPYFTTKRGGTGLGLATTFAVINNHGGKILVDSALGLGTTFTIYLPALGSTLPDKGLERKAPGAVRGAGCVLVMDDDGMVRELASASLERFGFDVQTCIDGEEAIALYVAAKEAGKPFRFVVMDLTIPGGMGGAEAAQQILALDPEAKLIVSSGYSDDPIMANFRTYGFCGALDKPYSHGDLAALLVSMGICN
jgi:PAS domain S-box-containing protein